MKEIANKQADEYFAGDFPCREESLHLRDLLLSMGLTETIKWGKPAYMHNGKNIVIIQNFKKYCALLFFKGYLLKDPMGILVKTGTKTIEGRQIRFDKLAEITDPEKALRDYVRQAIEIEKK